MQAKKKGLASLLPDGAYPSSEASTGHHYGTVLQGGHHEGEGVRVAGHLGGYPPSAGVYYRCNGRATLSLLVPLRKSVDSTVQFFDGYAWLFGKDHLDRVRSVAVD